MTRRSVSTGPGLIATTRSPSAGAPLPSARVNAISDAFPAAPAIYPVGNFSPAEPITFTITPARRAFIAA